MSRVRHLCALTALGALLIGCGDDSSTAPASTIGTTAAESAGTPESNTTGTTPDTTPETAPATTAAPEDEAVVLRMVDNGFDMPDVLQGPAIDIEVINDGAVAHELAFVSVAPGTTGEQVLEALMNRDDEASFILGDPGGINLLGGGERLRYQRLLEPGSYVAFCPLALADGATHMEQGMFRAFTVSDGTNADLPAADLTITLSDDGIGLPELSAGTFSVAIANAGSEPHELYILGVPAATDPGIDIDGEVGEWIEGGQRGPAPREFHFPGGHQSIAPGESVVLTMTLRAGYRYHFEDFSGAEPLVTTATV